MYHLRLFLDETRLPVHRSLHPDPELELDLDLGSRARARALLDVSLERIRPLPYRRLGPGAGAGAGASTRAVCARTQIRRAQRTLATFRTDGEADGLRGRVSVPCRLYPENIKENGWGDGWNGWMGIMDGKGGDQITCPNPTSTWLISPCSALGSHDSRASLASSMLSINEGWGERELTSSVRGSLSVGRATLIGS